MKATSGPWEAQPSDDNEYEYDIIHGKYYVAIACDAPGDGTAEANARLIAAAPDLYEALSEVLEELLAQERIGIPSGVYRKAQAAIAKATGGEV